MRCGNAGRHCCRIKDRAPCLGKHGVLNDWRCGRDSNPRPPDEQRSVVGSKALQYWLWYAYKTKTG
ncbi:hypothetical protein CE195_07155, partial [Sodalis-like symbiont of Philaenus spumarius]